MRAGSPADGCYQHVVTGTERLNQHFRGDPAGAHDQRQGLLRCAKSWGEHLRVELEERDHIGRPNPVEHRLGADVDPGRGRRPLVGAADCDHRAGRGCFEFLAQPGHPRPKIGETPGTARLTHGRTNRRTTATDQTPVVAEPDGGIALFATNQRSTATARQHARPARDVADAHHRRLGIPYPLDQCRGHQRPLPRIVIGPIDHHHTRPPCPLTCGGRRHDAAGTRILLDGNERRYRRHQHAGHPCTTAPLDHDVAGMPRRCPLLLQRFVVLVDDDRRGQPRTRRPRRRTCADHHVDAAGSGGPLARHRRNRQPGAPQTSGEQRRIAMFWDDHQCRPDRSHRQDRRHHVGTRRQPEHTSSCAEHRSGRRRLRRRRHTGSAIERERPHCSAGASGDQEGTNPARGPPDRCPVGQLEELRGRAVAGHLGDWLERPVFGEIGAIDRADRSHPAADASAVEFDSNDRADLDGFGEIGGDQIVELLVEPGDIRHDPRDVAIGVGHHSLHRLVRRRRRS